MPVYSKNEIDEIVFELRNNKAAIIPTDTQIGILSLDDKLIYKIKKRSKKKKIVLFVESIQYVNNPSEKFKKLANKFWPGELTLIENKISYRIPNSETILKILSKIGKAYCSSANISNSNPILNVNDAIKEFEHMKHKLILVDIENNGNNISSTIYDIDNNIVLREGEIKKEDIEGYLNGKLY